MRKTLCLLLIFCLLTAQAVPTFALTLESAGKPDEAPLAGDFAVTAENAVVYASAKTGASFDLPEGAWRVTNDGGTDASVNGRTLTATGYAGIVTLEADGETLTVHLVGGNKWRPGLNFLTGTLDPIDITEENGALAVGENADVRPVNFGGAADTNPVAQYETNYGTHFFPIEEMPFDRRMLISFDFTGASNTTRILVNTSREHYFYYDFGDKNNKGKWDTYRYDGPADANATSNYASINKIGFIICWSGYVEAFFDNYLFVPFYKITYTGAQDADVYYLYDDEGNVASAYPVDETKTVSPDDPDTVFLGWSTQRNALEPMAVVPLHNEDVTLYPVWRLENAVPYELAVDGPSEVVITPDEKTYAFAARFDTAVPDKSISWSVDDESTAVIDENGVLTPLKTGSVTVTAAANYYPYKSASKKVSVRYDENAQFVTVRFEGDVQTLPADLRLLKGARLKVNAFNNCVSALPGKRFNGWSADGGVLLDDPVIEEDTVLTAVVNDDYNFAVPANLNDWRFNAGGTSQENNELVCTYNATHTDPYITNDTLSIAIPKYRAIDYLLDVNYKENGVPKQLQVGQTLEATYFSRTGEDVHWQRHANGTVQSITEDGKYALVHCDMSTNNFWEGTLQLIRFDFIGNAKYDFAVRYIRFVPRDEFKFDTVSITGIDAPVTGRLPDADGKTGSADFEIASIEWEGALSETGRFAENTSYTVKIALKAADRAHRFAQDATATVDGREAGITVDDMGNALVTLSFDETEPLIPFTAVIDGPDTVGRKDRSFAYRLAITSEKDIPDKTAVWSTDAPEIVDVDENTGRVTAKKNGTFTLSAVSNYDPSVTLTKTVAVAGIDDTPAHIVFHPGTQDAFAVCDLPEDLLTNELMVDLTAVGAPKRDGYVFLGWSLKEDSVETADGFTVTGDTDVYAVWGKGLSFDFNGTDHGVKPASCTTTVGDTHLTVQTNAKQLDARLELPGISLDPKVYGTVQIKMAVDTPSMIEVFFGADGSGIHWANAKQTDHAGAELDKDELYTIDLSAVTGWKNASRITAMWVDPFQSVSTTARIDYIRVLDPTRTVTYDAADGVLVSGNASVKAAFGSTLLPAAKAEKDGCRFLGWSKTPDGKMTQSVFVNDDITLYAVYAPDAQKTDNNTAVIENVRTQSDTAVLVKTAAGASVSAKKGDYTVSGRANANGYAVLLLAPDDEPSDVKVTSSADVISACVTSEANAESIAEAVKQTKPSSGGADKPKSYDLAVQTVENEREAYNTDSANGSAADDLASKKPIFFGFDKAYEKDLFLLAKNASPATFADGVLTYHVLSKSGAKKFNTELTTTDVAFDADSHRYAVVRARGIGLDNPRLRLRYRKAFGEFSNIDSVRCTLSDEYAVYVYDMKKTENWYGTVEQLQFLLESNNGGTLDIDWLLFTNDLPADTEGYDEASDLFAAVKDGNAPFEDVKEEAWYFGEVTNAYKRGLVEGRSANAYEPESDVTVAEVLTLAVRLRCRVEGKEPPKVSADGAWYADYVSQALSFGIDDGKRFANYTVPAARRDVAFIMARALPDAYLKRINLFSEVPDMTSRDRDRSAVLKLYGAGVLTGADEAYDFLPDAPVTRAEMAAIVLRMALPSARKRVFTEEERLAGRKTYTAQDIVSGASKSVTYEDFRLKDGMAVSVSKYVDTTVIFGSALFGQLNGSDVSKITIGVKFDTQNVKPALQLFYLLPGENWTESHSFRGVVTSTDENGVMNVEFDTSSAKPFKNIIEELRFDPFDAKDVEFAIAYIVIE